jgi:hypothetical protein
MTPNLALNHKLLEATRRIRLLLILQWVGRTLLAGSGFCLIWLVCAKFGWMETPAQPTVTAILFVSVVAGIGAGLAHKLTRQDVARLTDGRTDFKDRLASAVEFESDSTGDPLMRRQLDDANSRASDLDLRRAYPLRLNRELIAALALTVVVFLAYLLPTIPLFWPKSLRQEIADVKRQAAEMQKVVRIEEKTANQQKLEDSKKAAREADKMLEAMRKSNTTKKAAMITLAKMTKQIEAQQKQMASANAPGQKTLQKASEEIKKALEQRQQAVEAADKAKKDAAKSGEKQGQKPGEKSEEKSGDKAGEKQQQAQAGSKQQSQAMEQAQQALQKFAQALADQNSAQQNAALQQLADQMEKGQLSQEEMQTLQQQMQQMSQALKGTDLQKVSEQMKQIAEMMKKLDPATLKKLAALMRQAGGT